MQNQQLELFAESRKDLPRTRCYFDREKWFREPHPPEWREREYERALEFVRSSLPVILESFRGAETFPWQPNELRALRIIFHNRSSWLPPEECEGLPRGVSRRTRPLGSGGPASGTRVYRSRAVDAPYGAART